MKDSINPTWTLVSYLTIEQVALLILGYDPDVQRQGQRPEPDGMRIWIQALQEAARTAKVSYRISEDFDPGWGGDPINRDAKIEVTSLKKWLKEMNAIDNFFLPPVRSPRAFADSTSEFYAPKLAAAIDAWTAVTSMPLKGTPKQALIEWLKTNLGTYEITASEGIVEEIAKIANWSPSGGSPRTLGS
jgi:hypothetical protein